MKKTELKYWDKYMEYLKEAIDESKFMMRAETKPMSTPRGASESHVTSRATHSRAAANIAKRIAEGLGLNGDYIYCGMLMHDAGHPFSAHEGEEIFGLLGQLYNCGYYHHNAKGIEVIRSEDILGKAIAKIPNIKDNAELEEHLREEFPYFLDVVISHDGEATRAERKKQAEPYATIDEAVETKLRKSNSENDYKFVAQTEEGKLAKMADVIAYLASDIQDGFRIGIIEEFDDDYLELFGRMFTTGFSNNREDNITCAKKILSEIKLEKLRELKDDIHNPINASIAQQAIDIIKEAEKNGARINSSGDNDKRRVEEILEGKIEEMLQSSLTMGEEKQQFIHAEIEKLREFVNKMLTVNTAVVSEITTRMQEYFINDVLSNSQKLESAQFSAKAELLFDQLKNLNYEKIVQYTKWDYQRGKQPDAAAELIAKCAKSLIKSGAIRNKFYDEAIREQIPDEMLPYMRTEARPESKYDEYKAKIGLKKPSTLKESKKKYKGSSTKMHKHALYRDVNKFVQKKGENFVVTFKNVFAAIPSTVRQNVEQALEEEPKLKGFLQPLQQEKIGDMKTRIIEKYGSIDEARKNKEELITMLVEEERSNMEKNVAVQLAIDYISGMTDRGFNELAIKTKAGNMTHEDIIGGTRDNVPSESVVALIAKNNEELNKDPGDDAR